MPFTTHNEAGANPMSKIGIRLDCKMTNLDEKSSTLKCNGTTSVWWSTNSFPWNNDIATLANCPLAIGTNSLPFVEASGRAWSMVESRLGELGTNRRLQTSFVGETTGYYNWSRYPRDRQFIILRFQLLPGQSNDGTGQCNEINTTNFEIQEPMASQWIPKTMYLGTYQKDDASRHESVYILPIERRFPMKIIHLHGYVTLSGFALGCIFLIPLTDIYKPVFRIIILMLVARSNQVMWSGCTPVVNCMTSLDWFMWLSFSLHAIAAIFVLILYCLGYIHESKNDAPNFDTLRMVFSAIIYIFQGIITLTSLCWPRESWTSVKGRVERALDGHSVDPSWWEKLSRANSPFITG